MSSYLINSKQIPLYGLEGDFLISREAGAVSYGFELTFPVIFHKDKAQFLEYKEIKRRLFEILVCDYIIHETSWFLGDNYKPVVGDNESDLKRYNRVHFSGRKIRQAKDYLFITKVPPSYFKQSSDKTNKFLIKKKSGIFSDYVGGDYIKKLREEEFLSKKQQIMTLLSKNKLLKGRFLKQEDLMDDRGVLNLYNCWSYDGVSKDRLWEDKKMWVGDRRLKYYTLENANQLSDNISPFVESKDQAEGFPLYRSHLSALGLELDKDHVLNRYYYLPGNDRVLAVLDKRERRMLNNKKRLYFSMKDVKQREDEKKHRVYDEHDLEHNKGIKSIREFKKEVVGGGQRIVYTHINVGIMDEALSLPADFKLGITENTTSLQDLMMASCVGHAIGLPSELYMPLTESAAIALSYHESENKSNTVGGLRLVDPITGNPVEVNLIDPYLENGIIDHCHMAVMGATGSGKSFSQVYILCDQYEKGADLFGIDGSSSFARPFEKLGGINFIFGNDSRFSMNPFMLKENSRQERELKVETAANMLVVLLNDLMLQNETTLSYFHQVMTNYYEDVNFGHGFNSVYEYMKEFGGRILKEHGIHKRVDYKLINFLLKPYYKGGVYDFLLNGNDQRLADLKNERIVNFQLKEIKNNPKYFNVVSFALMSLYREKLYAPEFIGKRKILNFDECHIGMNNPVYAKFIEDNLRTGRSQNSMFILSSQNPEDFLSNEFMKGILNQIKILLIQDAEAYRGKVEMIKREYGFTDLVLNQIYSLSEGELPPGVRKGSKKMAVVYQRSLCNTYIVETSKEEGAFFETNPKRKEKLFALDKKYNGNKDLTALHVAGN